MTYILIVYLHFVSGLRPMYEGTYHTISACKISGERIGKGAIFQCINSNTGEVVK